MASLKQVTEESRQMRDWLSVTSLKQAMATELWRGRMADSRGEGLRTTAWCRGADSRCRRGEGLVSRGGLPLPEGRGPGVEGRTPAAGGERAWCRGADSGCRRGEGLLSRGGLPLPEGRGPAVLVAEKDWSVRYESTEQKNGVE